MSIKKVLRLINLLRQSVLRAVSVWTSFSLVKPQFVSLEIEDRCCLKCKHCDIWKKSPQNSRLSLDEQKIIVKKLSDWLGQFYLNFDGGEPFLNNNIFKLAKYAAKLGAKTRVSTNGVLIDKKMAQKIIDSEMFCVMFSLDSSKPEVHDWVRGVKGTHEKAVRAIKVLNKLRKDQKSKIRLTVNTVLMKQNLESIEKLVYWVDEQKLNGISFQPIEENFGRNFHDMNWFKTCPFWPDINAVEETINVIINLKKKGYPVLNSYSYLKMVFEYFEDPLSFSRNYPCRVGLNNFLVNLEGKVHMCYSMGSCGDALKELLSEIWKGDRAKLQRQAIAGCQRSCRVLLCNQRIYIKDLFQKVYYEKIKKN